MRYNDFRDDLVAEVAAVLAKYGGVIHESDDCGEWIISLPATPNGKRMGACGSFIYVHDIANHMFNQRPAIPPKDPPP
jgi:hypothetical protein